MSRGLGKLQLAILEAMKEPYDMEGFYTYDMYALKTITGKSQQSINRALNGLFEKGLVTRHKEVGGWGRENTWRYAYLLPSKVAEHLKAQEQWKTKQGSISEEERIERFMSAFG